MSKFNSTRNKLIKTYNKTDINKNQISKLDNITIVKKSNDFFKQQAEIIIEKNKLVSPNAGIFRSYQFDNLKSNQLCYIKPYVIFNTNEQYSLNDLSYFSSNYWWEEYNIKDKKGYILRINIGAYILIEYPSGFFSSTIAPYYYTVKLKIYNLQTFKTLINAI